MTPYVLLAGAPGSGNHLLQRGLKRWGTNSLIWHGNPVKSGVPRRFGQVTHVVVPVRNPRIQRLSAPSKGVTAAPDVLLARVLRALAARELPVLLVSYEGLVQDPEGVGRYLAEWLGLSYTGWGEEIRDGNQRYD